MEDQFTIEDAEREGSRLVLGFAGQSGGGKTQTALLVAWGLANYNSQKVGLIDAENRRGRLYANVLKDADGKIHKFKYMSLDAPFSPRRYKQAILQFQAAGIEVLVIDSVSHEWEGTGGCDEIAANTSSKMPDWKKAKAEHKLFMNTLLYSDMHIIACIRARQKTDFKDPRAPKDLGVQPICEKNFPFELTASLMMHDKGQWQENLKCPGELLPYLGREKGYITPADGKAIRDWVDGAKKLDPRVEHARNTLRTTTEQGMLALQAAWKALSPEIRRAISPGGCPSDLKASAEEFDRLRAEAAQGGADLNEINDALSDVPHDAAADEAAAA